MTITKASLWFRAPPQVKLHSWKLQLGDYTTDTHLQGFTCKVLHTPVASCASKETLVFIDKEHPL